MGTKIKMFVRNIFSRPIFQPFFEKIFEFSLKVMNIGDGHTVETSGEESVFKVLEKISKEKVIVFDVGAHIGEWFKLFKSVYKKDAIVYSFEPSKESYSELSKIKTDNLYPINIAFGDKEEKMYLSFDNAGDSTAYVSNQKNTNKSFEEINVTTIDAYCLKNKINKIDLLKLDVEGYELKILSGAKKMIQNGNIKMIQFEFGAPSEEKYSLKDFFNVLGEKYDIYRILKHGVYKIEYKHYFEILSLTNFVAIKKI